MYESSQADDYVVRRQFADYAMKLERARMQCRQNLGWEGWGLALCCWSFTRDRRYVGQIGHPARCWCYNDIVVMIHQA